MASQDQVFEHWFTYASIGLWVGTVGVWLYRLNDALSKFNPLFIIPLLQCFFIFFAIVAGGIFFQEFNEFTAGQWVGFVFGVGVMFSGLVFLIPADESDGGEVEEGGEGHLGEGAVVGEMVERPRRRTLLNPVSAMSQKSIVSPERNSGGSNYRANVVRVGSKNQVHPCR